MMAQWDLEMLHRSLPQITAPILFLHGTKDQAVALEVAKRAQGMVPQGALKVISDAGHLLPESHPAKAVDAITDFVQSLRKK